MRQFVTLALTLLTGVMGCTQRSMVRRERGSESGAMGPINRVAILAGADTVALPARRQYLGTVAVRPEFGNKYCTFAQSRARARELARIHGANLIVVTSQQAPTQDRNCFRMDGLLFFTPDSSAVAVYTQP